MRATAAVLLCIVAMCTVGCSSGRSPGEQQTTALGRVQVVIKDANALYRAEGEYAVDMQHPCPTDLTPGTFPGYTCGASPDLTPVQLRQAEDAISSATARLATDERQCLAAIGDLRNGKAGKLTLRKSSCEISLAPAPRDAPAG